MTAKEYLSQAATLKRRIKQIEDRIEELRTEASSPKAIRYDKDMIQSSPSGDALANYMIRLDHEERKLIRMKEQYLDIHEEIRNRILLVRPDLYADVLYMRYLEGKSLVDIAEELLYSYIYVCKLHGRALLEFARKNPDIC
jgi:DNA-directed RNA polymerase specialized sigma subunit